MPEHLHLGPEHIVLMGTAIALFYWLVHMLMAWLALHTPGALSNFFTAVGAFYPSGGK